MNRLIWVIVYICLAIPAEGKNLNQLKNTTAIGNNRAIDKKALKLRTPNITGTWHGKASFNDDGYHIELYIQQQHTTLTGILISHELGGTIIHHLKGIYDSQHKQFNCNDERLSSYQDLTQEKTPICHYIFSLAATGEKLSGTAKTDSNTNLSLTLFKRISNPHDIGKKDLPLTAITNVNPREIICEDSSGKAKTVNLQAGYIPILNGYSQEDIQSNDLLPISQLENHTLELINNDRAKYNAPILELDSKLSNVARNYAEYMLQKKFFGHMDPKGRTPPDRVREFGIICDVYENIAFEGCNTACRDMEILDRIEDAFMSESPNECNHRYNILLPKHVCVGIGVARSHNHLMVVEEFANSLPILSDQLQLLPIQTLASDNSP